jgi:hypothetical protein
MTSPATGRIALHIEGYMKICLLILAAFFICLPIHAQVNVVTIPAGPIIKWCNSPANAVPCSNLATTYTDITLSTPCPTATQIVREGSTQCVSTPDGQNNWRVWVPGGNYEYTITIGGMNYGPFHITAAGTCCTSPVITNPTITGTDSGAETLANKTLTAPIVNGTPTGTGIATVVQKVGSGTPNYVRLANGYADVDTANLSYTVVVPTGWKATITFSGSAANAGGGTGLICLADVTTVLREVSVNTVSTFMPMFVQAVFTGDGASHTFRPRFQGDNVGGTNTILNNSVTNAPVMVVRLEPSN